MNKKTLSAIAALLVALGTLLGALISPDSTTTTRTTTTATPVASAPPAVIAVDGADKDAKPDDPVALGTQARAIATDLAQGAQTGANDLQSREAGLPPLAGPSPGPVAQLQPPFASDSVPGCRTRFLTTNWSARAGSAKPSLFWLHYSGGPDRPGTRSEVDGLTAFGNSPSAAVSWHFNMDKDGNCDYNVPLRYKAWTEAGANSTGISIEVAGTGTAPYLRAGGYKELAKIYLELHRRYGIPLRLGAVHNCSPSRSGIVTHWMGGPCSGGHTDIHPLDLATVIRELKKYVASASCNSRCRTVRALRARHRDTHRRIAKNRCAHGRKDGSGRPRIGGYCQKLRTRNAAIHKQAKAQKISLAGTYK